MKPGQAGAPLEESVVKQAAAMLGLSLDPLAMNKLRADETHTANAYDYYVLGSGYLQRYDQAGNIGSSVAAFQRAIQLDPSYAMAYAGLSAAWVRQYRSTSDAQYLERARDAAMQALSRNESLDAPHIALGEIAMSAGQTGEGIRQLRMALDRDPVNADAARELANAYLQAGSLSNAESTYKRSIQLRPNFWLGYLNLGTFYNNLGRYAEAEQQLQAAARLTPDNYVVFRNLGGVQMARGEWADAERSLKQAIGLRPGGSVYSNLGTLYIYNGRYAEAVPVLEQAVALAGSDEKYAWLFWGNLGDAYRWTGGRETSAAAAWKKAVELASSQLAVNPNDAALVGQIAVYEAKLAQFRQAEERVRTALKLAHNDAAILFDAALVMEMAGHRARSLEYLASALRSGYSLDVVGREPELASLRKDPRYGAIAARPEGAKMTPSQQRQDAPVHAIHIRIDGGIFGYQKPDSQDAAHLSVRKGDRVKWHCEHGNYAVLFHGDSPFADIAVHGRKGAETDAATVVGERGNYKYSVMVSLDSGPMTDDPVIIVGE